MYPDTRELYHLKLRAEARRADAEAAYHEQQVETYKLQLRREEEVDRETAAMNPANNVFHLMGEINGMTTFQSMRLLEKYARLRPEAPIEMLITSAGGSVVDGLALFDRIVSLRRAGAQINTFALGMAGSISGLLLQAGDVRAMGQEAWLLIHEASFNAQGSMGEIQDTMGWVEKIQDRIVDIFVSRSNVSRKQFLANWKRKAWWVSSDEALKLGFADVLR